MSRLFGRTKAYQSAFQSKVSLLAKESSFLASLPVSSQVPSESHALSHLAAAYFTTTCGYASTIPPTVSTKHSSTLETSLTSRLVSHPQTPAIEQKRDFWNVKGPSAYKAAWEKSVTNPDVFWDNAKTALRWSKPYDKVSHCNLKTGLISWYLGGKLNATVNCIDRHLDGYSDKTAIIYEADEPGQTQHITYAELHAKVCQLANALKRQGVKQGDCVAIYMPTCPDAVYAMLACARIGAVHTVIFGGFSAEAVHTRLVDAQCKVIITANEGVRAGKRLALKRTIDQALEKGGHAVTRVIVASRTDTQVPMTEGRDIDMNSIMAVERPFCAPVDVDSEDPLFILYTSGSTGKPKGIVHSTAGYLVSAMLTQRVVFDCHEGDVFASTADIGWITGHTYTLYGPLLNGGTTVLVETTPTYPDAGRWWKMVESLKITHFYTAPTAIRLLIKAGDDHVKKYNRSSLRVLGSVGEPINPEAWHWFHRVVGDEKCPVVDTFWQTETGSIVMAPLPDTPNPKPGSCMQPFLGCDPVLLDDDGKEITQTEASGLLALRRPIPSMARTILGDHKRFVETYFGVAPVYLTGDGCRRDKDGHYTITGRVDDVINVSGHRLGTAEVESALVTHPAVAESAVVGFPHAVKGEGVFVFVILKDGYESSEMLANELKSCVRGAIGGLATPDVIVCTPGLPKTRSGKIMRRILKKLVRGEIDSLGDTSTLAEPQIVETLTELCQPHWPKKN